MTDRERWTAAIDKIEIAVNQIREAFEDIQEVKNATQATLDALSESDQESDKGERLQSIIDAGENILAAADEIESDTDEMCHRIP